MDKCRCCGRDHKYNAYCDDCLDFRNDLISVVCRRSKEFEDNLYRRGMRKRAKGFGVKMGKDII